eukprot:2616766-Prymnesium_polylepis.1
MLLAVRRCTARLRSVLVHRRALRRRVGPPPAAAPAPRAPVPATHDACGHPSRDGHRGARGAVSLE